MRGPAEPEEGYGLEKLFMEKLCQYYREDHGLETRVVRFHNVYGPLGHLRGRQGEGARRDLPQGGAARPTAVAIEVWGDGLQTRSFMYVDDCVGGHLPHHGDRDYPQPLNLGTDELVTINELVDTRRRGRRQDHRQAARPHPSRRACAAATATTRACAQVLGWEPKILLREGLVPDLRLDRGRAGEGRAAAERGLNGAQTRRRQGRFIGGKRFRGGVFARTVSSVYFPRR